MNPWCHHEELFWKQWFWLNYGDLTGWKESQCEFTDCQIGSEIFSCVDRGRTAWNIDLTVHSQLPVRRLRHVRLDTETLVLGGQRGRRRVSAPHHQHCSCFSPSSLALGQFQIWVTRRGSSNCPPFPGLPLGKSAPTVWRTRTAAASVELLSQAGSLLAAGVSALSYSSHWSLLSAHHLCGGKSVCAFQTQTFSDLLGKNSSLSWTGTI